MTLLSVLERRHHAITVKEEVVTNGGGRYTVWNASGITSGTTGTHTVQAASS